VIRRVIAVAVFGSAGLLLVGGLAGLVVATAGWEAAGDLGRRGAAQVGLAYAAAGLALAWIGWAIWPARDRTD